ncbi:hypothetical protein CHS0354_019228 [Potamilus streckersoni]|uniref:Uncharacterized protein n=1 Tax=Potamilus streckersoni TaxID=2493646 RepID=A0AAE0T087_9BIVA|nr:hypothetical protein CHS0354_019228 [Potamilus streckersoni]
MFISVGTIRSENTSARSTEWMLCLPVVVAAINDEITRRRASADGMIMTWCTDDWSRLSLIENGQITSIRCLDLSEDNTFILTGRCTSGQKMLRLKNIYFLKYKSRIIFSCQGFMWLTTLMRFLGKHIANIVEYRLTSRSGDQ